MVSFYYNKDFIFIDRVTIAELNGNPFSHDSVDNKKINMKAVIQNTS